MAIFFKFRDLKMLFFAWTTGNLTKNGDYPVNSGMRDRLKCLFAVKTTGFLTNFDIYPVVFRCAESAEAQFFS